MTSRTSRPAVVRHFSTGWRLWTLSLLSGLLAALGQAPFSLPYLLLFALPLIGWLFLNQATAKRAFLTGWLAGCGYFALSMFWIVEPFFVEPEVFGWMAPFALVFLAAGLALFWGLSFSLAYLARGRIFFRLLALALMWTALEFVRSHIFTGFPWGLIGYVWSDTPMFQYLAFIGPHGLGLMTLMLGFLPLMASRNILIGGAYTILATGMLSLAAWYRLPETVPLTDTTVRLIQPNAPQHLKWRADKVSMFFNRALKLTHTDTGSRTDVVIWPETSIPFLLGNDTAALEAISDAAGPETQLLAGIRRRQDGRIYNSMLYLDGAGGILAVYDKHHLVPFGEYIPFAGVLSKFGLQGLAAEDGAGFQPGEGKRILGNDVLGTFLPLICYEAIFPGLVQIGSQRPDWLLHITNDAWFGNYSGPFQHLVQIRARAIEQGLPVARSANTGVSAVIDPYGRIVDQIPLNTAGYLDVALPKAAPKTAYAIASEFPWLVFLAFGLISVVRESRKTARKPLSDK